jgi:large subunit ribosomal protein L1
LRADQLGYVRACIGKKNFEEDRLKKNLEAVVNRLWQLKPDNLKSVYVRRGFLKTSNSKPLEIDISSYQ